MATIREVKKELRHREWAEEIAECQSSGMKIINWCQMKGISCNTYRDMGCGCPVDTSAKGRSTDRAGRRDRRHLWYLKKHHRTAYAELLASDKLNDYLADLNEQAEEMFFRLVKELAEKESITETLKTKNQMLWVQRMNSVCQMVAEIVNHEFIYA